MVEYTTALVRFGELSTKGKNRKDFIQKLFLNIKHTFKDCDFSFKKTHDRIYIDFDSKKEDIVRERLKKVFGISSFSFTTRVDSVLEDIEAICLEIAKENEGKTFKAITKRKDKTFPLSSDEMNRKIASVILKNTNLKVDVHNPELPIQIEIQERNTYITTEKIRGAGGYPAGMNGKVLLLLSGGIDSPVAAYELMKRGLKVEAVHFASPPYTSEAAKNKVLTLAKLVSEYQQDMKVHLINFTDLQLEIYKTAGDAYAITLMRRMMFRLAEAIAKKNGCLALGSGESVGQVASQTLES
ncbi:MAG: tRNA 4-thiouridine(8) synthase ThiI, partial [Solobacterium sp.]|nr:tRNA 4-thiouridine(8) synthase ThiI [Solobacterium sp.]